MPTKRRGRTALTALVLAGSLLAAAACGDDETADSGAASTTAPGGDGVPAEPVVDPFGEATWELTAGTVDGDALTLVEDFPVTLTVADGRASGTSACNSYNAEVTMTSASVAFGPIASTEMACVDEDVMALEAAYLDALSRVDAAGPEGAELVLTGAGVELRYTAQAEVPDAALADTEWLLESLVSGDAVTSTVAGTEATLLIGDDGQSSGSTGCNTFAGLFEVVDGRLETTGLATTRMACGSVQQQEDHVLGVLNGAPTIAIEGDSLTLMLDDGRGLVYRSGV